MKQKHKQKNQKNTKNKNTKKETKKSKKNSKKPKVNFKVIIYSLIALFCLHLTFAIDWLFIIPAVFLSWLNQKELTKKSD